MNGGVPAEMVCARTSLGRLFQLSGVSLISMDGSPAPSV